METVILKYSGQSGREIFFEPRLPLPEHGKWIDAKDYFNSQFLQTGHFEKYTFNPNFVTEASPKEKEAYLKCKAESPYLKKTEEKEKEESALVRQTPHLTGAERIALERQRQVNNEMITAEHDDKYTTGQLRRAAVCYELAALNDNNDRVPPRQWPLPPETWKPAGVLRNLEKAGALYQADIDRILRKPGGKEKKEIILFLEGRIKNIADEIDLFLRPIRSVDPDDQSVGEKSAFGIMNSFNEEHSSGPLLLAEAMQRQPLPLYYEDHLRRKLAVRKDSYEPLPSGSIMNYQEVCVCETGLLCNHRLEWLIAYLKRANTQLNARTMESQATIDVLLMQIEDLKSQLEPEAPEEDDLPEEEV